MVSGNPIWECLEHQHNWILDTLSHCKDEHTAREYDECELASSGRAASTKGRKLPTIMIGGMKTSTPSSKVGNY